MGVLYIFAGIMHFLKPRFYLRMMPARVPLHKPVVYISGVIEILLGILLFYPPLRAWAAWGIILLLIAVLPANYEMYRRGGAGMKIPRGLLLLRLPLQFVLIAWAYIYT